MVKLLSVLIGAVLMISPVSAQAAETVINRILVKINDNIITQYDLDEEMKPVLDKVKGRQLSDKEKEQLKSLRKKALENLVNDVLIQQEVAKYGIGVTDENMDKEIERVREERGLTLEEFENVVHEDGLEMEEFRSRLKEMLEKQELISHMVTSKVLVTDSEIQEEYEARHDDYQLDKMVELAIILLPSDVSAVEVRERILGGEMTFAEAVQEYSVGPGKDLGGSIGELSYVDLATEWKESLTGVAAGGVGTPLTIQGKEALLSPVSIAEDRLVPLDDVRDDIYKQLMQNKRETLFSEYFEKLKQSSVIVYMDKTLEPDNGVSQ